MRDLITPYLLYIKLAALVAVFLYIAYLNICIAHLETKYLKCANTVFIQYDAINTQNDAIKNVVKHAQDAQEAAAKLLSKAKQAHSIALPKITRATASILLKTNCDDAIVDIKKDLQ